MRTNLDFTPFYRSSVGFDRLFNLLENSTRLGSSPAWPAYDIIRTSEDAYRIRFAIPGFTMDRLEIVQQPNLLVISGKDPGEDKAEYLHHGIEAGGFEHRFELADYVEVAGATLVDGVLTIDLKRELPEAMKPRKIEIAAGAQAHPRKQIESSRQAA